MAYRWQDFRGMTQLGLRIGAMVEAVKHDPPHHGVLSTGEKLAVALVLNDFELLGGYTMLQAVDRVGEEWLVACRLVEKAMDE